MGVEYSFNFCRLSTATTDARDLLDPLIKAANSWTDGPRRVEMVAIAYVDGEVVYVTDGTVPDLKALRPDPIRYIQVHQEGIEETTAGLTIDLARSTANAHEPPLDGIRIEVLPTLGGPEPSDPTFLDGCVSRLVAIFSPDVMAFSQEARPVISRDDVVRGFLVDSFPVVGYFPQKVVALHRPSFWAEFENAIRNPPRLRKRRHAEPQQPWIKWMADRSVLFRLADSTIPLSDRKLRALVRDELGIKFPELRPARPRRANSS